MGIRDIVNVVITRQTAAVSRQGFGTILVVGPHVVYDDRVRYYTDPDALLDDGFAVDSDIYLAVNKAFSQNPRPVRVGVGTKLPGDATWTDALEAISDYNDEWYGLVITSHAEADVLEVAAWTEAQTKIFGTSGDDAVILDPTPTPEDIATQLEALGYQRTFVMYHEDADELFPEAALLGKQLPKDPGTETWKFKTLAGVTASALTDSEALAAVGKNVNIYQEIAGVSITREGKMAGGEFIDIIHGVDWLQARMTERIYGALVNLPKVPYTDAGIAVIEAEIRAQLEDGVAVGFLAEDPAFTVTVPKAADVPAQDKADRALNGVSFEATLAGAVHAVTINGVVKL